MAPLRLLYVAHMERISIFSRDHPPAAGALRLSASVRLSARECLSAVGSVSWQARECLSECVSASLSREYQILSAPA